MSPDIHQASAEQITPTPILGLRIPSSRLLILGAYDDDPIIARSSSCEFQAAYSPNLISRRLHDDFQFRSQ